MKDTPIISVIGIGESSDYGVKCINSILKQIFPYFELLLEKPFRVSELVKAEIGDLQKDDRVMFIFEPKISLYDKIQKARGQYIIFVDLNDEISIDYLRVMQEAAKLNLADIVASDILFRNEEGKLCYYNLDPFLLEDIQYTGKEIFTQFMRYVPLSISWSLLNNKLFYRELLLQCLEEISGKEKSLEDEAAVLLQMAMKKAALLKNVHQVYYILGIEHNISVVRAMEKEDKENQNFFQSVSTELTLAFDTWDNIKKGIVDSKVEYISFDIFDTLILRNVFEPADIFKFLNEDFNLLQHTKTFIDFSEIRQQGERDARKEIIRRNPSFEDVTLDEIYEYIRQNYVINPDVVDKLKEKEIELEIRFCKPRQCGKQLYELAKYCGKKIILTSDMYLPKEVIDQILIKNGFTDHIQVFLSSDIRLGKYTGNLYKYVKRELKASNQKILHIGDNWESDIVNAKNNGLKAFHFPKVGDLMRHNNPGIYTGQFFKKIFEPNGTWVDGRCAVDLFLGIRCMLSQVQNKFFDFPYMNFNIETDFNANPHFIGYFTLGMHLYALIEWICTGATEGGYKKIHFLARDGYLPLAAYKILMEDKPNSPEGCYTYMSRNLIVLCDITSAEDIYALGHKMNVMAATPKKLFKLFKPAVPTSIYEEAEGVSLEHGFIFEKPFSNMSTYYTFVKFFCETCIDFDLLKEYQKKLKEYFLEVFSKEECFFDVGYNGRVESALTAICGYPIDSFCLHTYKEIADSRAKYQNFKTHTFFNYQPVATFLLREQVFSKMTASVVGLDFNKQPTEVLFGDYKAMPQAEIVTEMMQNAAIEFILDYKRAFVGLEKNMHYRYMDASLPFEIFMHYAREKDRSIFKCVYFEDEFGDDIVFNLCDFWRQHLMEYQMTSMINGSDFSDHYIYSNGALMKLYKKINQWMPKGSKKREWIKKVANFFVK